MSPPWEGRMAANAFAEKGMYLYDAMDDEGWSFYFPWHTMDDYKKKKKAEEAWWWRRREKALVGVYHAEHAAPASSSFFVFFFAS